jgi:type IV pilus assembly protein PilV
MPLSISLKGFALIEVLTTILVVSFGLIGLAGMGVVGLKNNHMSYMRSIATQQAYDMSDRMRANIGDTTGGVKGGSYNSISGSATDPGCISTGCTYTQLAQYDQYAWNTANAALLPSGVGTVSGSTTTEFTITVSWTEVCDPNGGESGCSGGGAITRSFSTTFMP